MSVLRSSAAKSSAARRPLNYAALCVAFSLAAGQSSHAAEYGLGNYLMGLTLPMAGFTPPPGVYFSNSMYFYEGRAGGNTTLPFGRVLAAGVKERFLVNIATLSAFVEPSVLGGTLGFAATVPYGRANVSADLSFTGPLGVSGQANRSDSVTGFGDTALSAILGWHSGNHHWSIVATGFVPTGDYDANRLANMGLNRPAVDVKGAYTWLNMQTGTELSGALGVTFNGNNNVTDYKSGTELHIEAAAIQHLASGFSIGVGGYFYDQLTGDSGAGARLGAFKGRTIALGPILGYSFKAGALPITLNARWFHELDVENRMKGDAVFATLSMPLHVIVPPAPRPTK